MWYWIFKFIFKGLFKIFFNLKVEGLENIPPMTNFIIVANHFSFMDAPVVMAAVPRKIHCIASKELYRMFWLKFFLRLVEAVPSGNSSEKALQLLTQNENVGLFPEGGISRDGGLREFKRGVALLALKTGRPILPCAIIGTYQALPFGSRLPRFTTIKLKIGKPKYFLKEFEDIIDDIYLQEGILKIRSTIEEMINAG